MREKLIELLNSVQHYGVILTPSQVDDRYGYKKQIPNATIADNLIAHGVTVQNLDGCEYCKEDGEGFRKFNGAFWLARPFHGGEWFIRASNCKPRQIYFCPMCGRKLSEPPKGE